MWHKDGEKTGTGKKKKMVRRFSFEKSSMGILDYFSRNSVHPGKFPFAKMETDLSRSFRNLEYMVNNHCLDKLSKFRLPNFHDS